MVDEEGGHEEAIECSTETGDEHNGREAGKCGPLTVQSDRGVYSGVVSKPGEHRLLNLHVHCAWG